MWPKDVCVTNITHAIHNSGGGPNYGSSSPFPEGLPQLALCLLVGPKKTKAILYLNNKTNKSINTKQPVLEIYQQC